MTDGFSSVAANHGGMSWDAVNNSRIDGGFIPYSKRTREQKYEFGHIKERVRMYVPRSSALPDRALFYDAYREATAGLAPPRCRQMTGSCVGAATFLLYLYAQACDIVFRNTQEQLKFINPYWCWGIGRRKGGMNRPGEGSFGGAQAWAAANFGMVAIDAAGSPKPEKIWTPSGGKSAWHQWSAQVERMLSWPGGWPVAESQIAAIANEHQITTIARVSTVEDYLLACADGKPPTIASMFGSKPRITDGFLIGEWNDEWAHQMSGGGYIKHPKHGYLILIDNQWGPDPYGAICPYLQTIGLDGSMWVTESTLAKILHDDNTECYVHLDTEDWKAPPIDAWDAIASAA